MRDHDISQRRACRIVRCPAAVCLQAARSGVDPKTVRRDRPSRCPAGEWDIRREGDNADVREAMKEIAGKRRRFGYPLAGRRSHANAERRRIGVLLERKGYAMNHS